MSVADLEAGQRLVGERRCSLEGPMTPNMEVFIRSQNQGSQAVLGNVPVAWKKITFG